MDVRPLLDAIETERDIAGDLLDESERIASILLRTNAVSLNPVLCGRVRAHLAGLRTFLGGGCTLDTKES